MQQLTSDAFTSTAVAWKFDLSLAAVLLNMCNHDDILSVHVNQMAAMDFSHLKHIFKIMSLNRL